MLELGKETASGISTFSDKMLATMKASKLEESSVLLNNLNKIMDKFDPQDFAEEKRAVSSPSSLTKEKSNWKGSYLSMTA